MYPCDYKKGFQSGTVFDLLLRNGDEWGAEKSGQVYYVFSLSKMRQVVKDFRIFYFTFISHSLKQLARKPGNKKPRFH
jgi:hypothetical protein